MPTRTRMWEALGDDSAPWVGDVVVVGGGITGAGIARDAARRGLRTVLVEMGDLASGTSSRSSKLVHGGLRYLEQYEFSLVFEAVSERRILMDIAPHLVNPLAFLFPVYKRSRRGLWMINAGMWLYDGLSLFRSPKVHRTLKPGEVAKEEPALDGTDLTGAPVYYDCGTDDARLTLETALDAAVCGAVIATYTKVVGFLKGADGRITGVTVEDVLTGARKEIRANAVINATGPWTDKTIGMSAASIGGALLRPTKGVHVVVDRAKLPVQHAVVAIHPKDGRVLFAIPWGDRAYIGTTDTDYEGDPAEVAATRADVDYLIEAARAYFPNHPLTHADIVATWAGLRPLMQPPDAAVSESKVSREHQITVGADGLVTIAGGKLTTYRRMASEVVDTAVNLLRLGNHLVARLGSARTDEEPLPGAVGWPEDDDHDRVAAQIRSASGDKLTAAQARHLADTYGMRGLDLARRVASDPELGTALVEGRPEILGQVDWAVREELATRVSDVLIRRTQLYYRDVDQGLTAAGAIARRMASLLGWDDARLADELAGYEREVARSRRWRSEG
ncbi:MAG: glycerol-3-phosphate dehydrogenase [Myxococcota bacterium]